MGGVASSISSVASPFLGSIGSSVGGGLGSLGGNLADAAGITNNFQGVNPINSDQYNQQIQQGQGNFNNIQGNQQQLANALLAQSQGQGPNPAQMMLNQATNRNVQQGAGMIASQKGINPALAGRLASQNTSQANQQAAGQGAIMGAQQQLAAQQQLGGVYNSMGQQNNQNQGMLNDALLRGSLGSQGLSGQAAESNARSRAQVTGGLLGGIGSAGGAALGASHGAYVGGKAHVGGDDPSNDTVPAMLSPGEIVIPRSKAQDPDAAKEFVQHLLERKKKRKAA